MHPANVELFNNLPALNTVKQKKLNTCRFQTGSLHSKCDFDLHVAHEVLELTSLLFVCPAMYNSELITYLSSAVEDNMEFTIDRTYSEVSFDSFLCGFYV